MTVLSFHAYANLFPLIEGAEFHELAEDIREHGLAYRIDVLGAEILDGRNRYRALVWLVATGEVLGRGWGTRAGYALEASILLNLEAEIYRRFNLKTDGDPLAYVLSKNLKRRHLNESQRAMVAAELATLTVGRPAAPDNAANLRNMSQAEAATALGVSERSVSTAKAVQQGAGLELLDAVKQGHLAVSAAAEIAAQPAARQAEILQLLPRDDAGKLTADVKKALGPVIAELRAEKVAAKRERRADREAELGRKIQALPEKAYGVAIEDFEWDHAPWSRDTGVDRHPSMHYETAADAQTPAQIVARCAERFACLADDCILFKWVTVPHLAIGIAVLELQGFRYVTSLVWNKQRAGAARGPGYWFTGEHELVLVGTRGKVVPPAYAHFRSSFDAAVGEHSEKPANLHDIVEFHWPTTPKVEFNARSSRAGWAAWGFDAPAADAAIDMLPAPAAAVDPMPELAASLQPIAAAGSPARPDALRHPAGIVDRPAWIASLGADDAVPPAPRPGADLPRQCRIPLDDDEIAQQRALRSIDAGEAVDGAMARHLVGLGLAHCGTERITVTEQGRSFLAELADPPAEAAPLDLPLFL